MTRQTIKFTFISLFIWGMIFRFGPLVVNKINNINKNNQVAQVASALDAINPEPELNIPLQNDQRDTTIPFVEDIITTPKIETSVDKNFQPDGILKHEDIKKVTKVASFECPTPIIKYEDMSLVNIGQKTGLIEATYIPKDLKELNTTLGVRTGLCLTSDAKNAFKDLVDAASKDGYTIKASSGFRSYSTQKTLYNADLKNSGETISVAVAKPGYSEHQLGTAIDLTGLSNNYSSASDSFSGTPEDLWLIDNAYLYGFIQSYPKGKENTTGYKYEPWHYRYVGIEKAKEVYDSGFTLTEFL